jgi:hypothetical protein
MLRRAHTTRFFVGFQKIIFTMLPSIAQIIFLIRLESHPPARALFSN